MPTFPSRPPTSATSAPAPRRWRRAGALLAALLLAGVLTACATAVGPAGPPGADGEDGAAGPPGADGVANVIYSEWIPFDPAAWSAPTTTFGFLERRYTVAVPQLDAELIDQGLVFVYVRFGNGFQYLLPYLGAVTSTRDQLLQHRVSVGQIRMTFFNVTDRTEDPGIIGAGNAFRYVLVPGGVPVATALADGPDGEGVRVAAGPSGAAPFARGGR